MKRSWIIPLVLAASAARADTVYLKNGEWIDGKVSLKTDTFIELQIGEIGKIELLMEDVHSIEKNNRTGGKSVESYVEPKGKTEVLGARAKSQVKADTKFVEKRPADKKAADASNDGKGAKPESGEKPSGSDAEPEPEDAKEPEEDSGDPEPETAKPPIDPELKQRIETLVEDLQRQRSRNRVQAERHLEAIGQPTIPFLLPAVRHQNDLVRIAVMRLFHSFGDDQVTDAAIEGLLDDNEYVRDYANKTLKRVTGEDFGYQPSASPRRREASHRKWADWWQREKESLAEVRKLAEKAR